ncbi:response regulator transcription factor [Bifidobacterium sp. ESL0798]|uniref:response regulator transcription factor n=1 Tax=Bifidobacterium sp. ESL0798 TaxID=2983235 RepID=UPI0023F95C11|nr:response regulator transcription factor [Bifidobacterium sp. ESL0798]WEV73311.1 response regulator transcription factor [Bifidobacterium sp. ESL0798]
MNSEPFLIEPSDENDESHGTSVGDDTVCCESPVINLMIVDDQELVRAGIESILEYEDDFRILFSTESPSKALESQVLPQIDVALIDSRMPEMPGSELIARLRKSAPHIRSIMLTAFDEDDNLVASIKAGAAGHLLKDASADEIIDAIRRVAAGGQAFGEAETERLVGLVAAQGDGIAEQGRRSRGEEQSGSEKSDRQSDTSPSSLAEFGELSEENQRIASMAATGKTNREIAAAVCMSTGTVRNHLSSIFSLLGVRNRTELAVLLHD